VTTNNIYDIYEHLCIVHPAQVLSTLVKRYFQSFIAQLLSLHSSPVHAAGEGRERLVQRQLHEIETETDRERIKLTSHIQSSRHECARQVIWRDLNEIQTRISRCNHTDAQKHALSYTHQQEYTHTQIFCTL